MDFYNNFPFSNKSCFLAKHNHFFIVYTSKSKLASPVKFLYKMQNHLFSSYKLILDNKVFMKYYLINNQNRVNKSHFSSFEYNLA